MKVLMDLRTGEPVIDFNGNIVETNITRAFRQYIDVMLHTQIGDEPTLQTWGIPFAQIFQLSFNLNWEYMIKYMLSKSLNPRFEPLISEIRSIDAKRNGNEININLHLISAFGTEEEIGVSLNE